MKVGINMSGRASENKFRLVFENAPHGFLCFDRQGVITACNNKAAAILGSSREELAGLNMLDLPSKKIIKAVKRVLRGKTDSFEGMYQSLNVDKAGLIKADFSPIIIEDGSIAGGVVMIEDITRRQQVEDELILQKAYFQQLFDNSPEGIVMLDKKDRIVRANSGFERLFQYKAKEVKGRNINELIVPDNLMNEASFLSKKAAAGEAVQKETLRKRKDGSLINVSALAYPIVVNNVMKGIYVIYSDITERKQSEDRLKYLSLHDPLTGLFNRTYFEQEMRRYASGRYNPVGLIICDVDGLKIINDTLGHDAGDILLIEAARVIKSSFRESDVVARIGGDEFAVLLPNSPGFVVERAYYRITRSIERYNELKAGLPLSISIGFASGDESTIDMAGLFKEADNNMYREKLHRSLSARSAIVQTLMKALEARDFITEGHADRLQNLVYGMGQFLGLPERCITDLRLLAKFHDIGKVGIPDRILFKPDILTQEEIAEMKRHCEIGHRIAQAAPDLIPIADWILKHHEWWNGLGYPLGLKGEEIPLACRILAIADAYDAMTSDRPYRKAINPNHAMEELLKCAGTQFDPVLVRSFLDVKKRQSCQA